MLIVGDVHYYSIKALEANMLYITNGRPLQSPTSSTGSSPRHQAIQMESPTKSIKSNVSDNSSISSVVTSKLQRLMNIVGLYSETDQSSQKVIKLFFPVENSIGRKEGAKDKGGFLRSEAYEEKDLLRLKRTLKSSSFLNDFQKAPASTDLVSWVNAYLKKSGLSPISPLSSSVTKQLLDEIHLELVASNNAKPVITSDAIKRRNHSDAIEMKEKKQNPKKLYYVAEYYGTDDDFLMKASVRAYFKENALESDDAALFSIALDDESHETDGLVTEPHPVLPNVSMAASQQESVLEAMTMVQKNSKSLFLILVPIVIFMVITFVGRFICFPQPFYNELHFQNSVEVRR
jgi:hypothetical protein